MKMETRQKASPGPADDENMNEMSKQKASPGPADDEMERNESKMPSGPADDKNRNIPQIKILNRAFLKQKNTTTIVPWISTDLVQQGVQPSYTP